MQVISLNRALTCLRQIAPEAFKAPDFIRYFSERLNRRGKYHLEKGEPLGADNFNRRWDWDKMSGLLDIFNNVCRNKIIGYKGAVEFGWGWRIEFVLSDSAQIPEIKINMMLPKGKPLPGSRRALLYQEEPDFENVPDKIYREREVSQMVTDAYRKIGRLPIGREITGELYFNEVMRPRSKEHEEPLYIVIKSKPTALPGTVIIYFAEMHSGYTVAFRDEIAELVSEGRICPVYSSKSPVQYIRPLGEKWPFLYPHPLELLDQRRAHYFTPDIIDKWIDKGYVMEVETKSGPRYLLTTQAGALLAKGKAKIPPRSLPKASEVFLNFLINRRLSRRERNSLPLLAAAIDILGSSPQGTDPFFEAARIAAEYGASETTLAALLLGKLWSGDPRRGGLPETVRDFIDTTYQRLSVPNDKWCRDYAEVAYNVQKIQRLSHLDIGSQPISSVGDIRKFLNKFLLDLTLTNEPWVDSLEYFSSVLGRLRHTAVRGLSRREEKHLRIVVASMAEKCGFTKLAAEIRNEIFRINYNRSHERTKKEVEEVLGMTYPEAQLHLQNTAELITEALLKIGIPVGAFEVSVRTKTPYSVWEKIQTIFRKTNKRITPALLHDLLGISVITIDKRLAYRIVAAIQQLLPKLSAENFADRYGLLPFMPKNGSLIYSDEIATPKKSGFSAITMMRVTEMRLPVEIQVTTHKRDQVNRRGKAAHWKFKICREIEHFYRGFAVKPGDFSAFIVDKLDHI